jgi:hypothetical protein
LLGSATPPKSCFAGVPSCAAEGPANAVQRSAVATACKIIEREIDAMPIRRKSLSSFESTVKYDFGEMEIEEALSRYGR